MLHYTAMTPAAAALDRLCDPQAEVSCHYLITEDGMLCTLVDAAQRAWHAGAGRWGDITDVNSHSIGIELDNDGCGPFSTALMDTLVPLIRDLQAKHDILPERVIGHSDMAPARKQDPGRHFRWNLLADAGCAIAADPDQFRRLTRVSATSFYTDLATIGYDPAAPRTAQLAAFRLRHLPALTGPLTPQDAQTARDIAHRFPVDRRLR